MSGTLLSMKVKEKTNCLFTNPKHNVCVCCFVCLFMFVIMFLGFVLLAFFGCFVAYVFILFIQHPVVRFHEDSFCIWLIRFYVLDFRA